MSTEDLLTVGQATIRKDGGAEFITYNTSIQPDRYPSADRPGDSQSAILGSNPVHRTRACWSGSTQAKGDDHGFHREMVRHFT